MRNLKKILALVLALMMVLSVMVTSSAAFEDAAEIQHTEAVEVMSNLGILLGDGTNFNPNGTLTRAQAAVIIAKVMEGSVDNISVLVDAVDNPFTDVPAWALDYVLYAYSKGVVRGTSADKYTPNKNLTGYEFGKMLLVATGICKDADFNNNWKMVVAEELKDAKLLGGLSDLVLSKDLSREHAAQMAFNAMQYATTSNYGYAVKEGDVVLGFYPTMIEAATAAKVLGDGFTFETQPTLLKNDSLASNVFGLGTVNASVGIGFDGYYWFVDGDGVEGYTDAVKDVIVSSFICTDKLVGTYTTANSYADISAALGKKADYVVDTLFNGYAQNTDVPVDFDSKTKVVSDTDSNVTVVVRADKSVDFLYAQEYLTFASRGAKVTDKTSYYYGQYVWSFNAPNNDPITAVYGAADAYTNNAAYLVVPTAVPTIYAPKAVVGTIDGVAANRYLRVNGEVINLSDASADDGVVAAAGVYKTVYLNSVGDVIYVGEVGAAAPTVYDGHVYVKAYEYVATPYSATGLVGAGAAATITAKAVVVTAEGEELVVDLPTLVNKEGNTYATYYYLNGWQVATADRAPHAAEVNDWMAYTVEEGAYALDSKAASTITGAANKKAPVNVNGVKHYMDANTEIVFYYYNLSTGEVETYTNTGYANYNSGNYMNNQQAVVVADPITKVISSITFFSTKTTVETVKYAVYAGLLEEGTTDAKDAYGFYVDGELKTYFLANGTDLSGLAANDLVTFKTDVTGKVTEAAKVDYTYTNNVITGISADGTYIICGNYVNYFDSYGYTVYDATAGYALGELAIGQTISMISTSYGVTFIMITAQPVVE